MIIQRFLPILSNREENRIAHKAHIYCVRRRKRWISNLVEKIDKWKIQLKKQTVAVLGLVRREQLLGLDNGAKSRLQSRTNRWKCTTHTNQRCFKTSLLLAINYLLAVWKRWCGILSFVVPRWPAWCVNEVAGTLDLNHFTSSFSSREEVTASLHSEGSGRFGQLCRGDHWRTSPSYSCLKRFKSCAVFTL